MDRNHLCRLHQQVVDVVALRKESVDRNYFPGSHLVGDSQVALRKESVDRNHFGGRFFDCAGGSLSARRAWIEINLGIPLIVKGLRRSPQGERG